MIRFLTLTIVTLLAFSASAQGRKPPLHHAFLRSVTPGEFPVERWRGASADQVDSSIKLATKAIQLVGQFSSEDLEKINNAFDMRHGLLRWKSPSSEVEEVVENHRELLNALNTILSPSLGKETQSLALKNPSSEQMNAFWKLVCLAASSNAGQDRFDRASNLLAGAFAASRWWQRADSDETVLRAIVLEERLQRGLIDLQAIGAPLLGNAITKLYDSMATTKQTERRIWACLCNDLPVFKDKPRDKTAWQNDLKRTMEYYSIPRATVAKFVATVDSERVGLQLRQALAVRFKKIEAEGLIKLNETQIKDVSEKESHPLEKRIVEIISANFDLTVVELIQITRKLSMDARQRLMALQCIEAIRTESQTRKSWVDKLDADLRKRIPIDPRSGMPFDVNVGVFEGIGYPYYTIRLSASEKSESVTIDLATEGKYGDDLR
ncbi:MAG: hypothetical protein AAGG48_23485 [Planctomycetota bacterium]